jgi:K+-transporting ATPase ATPase C chain
MLLYGAAQLAFPAKAAGSLITRNGVVVGSRLIGQSFARPSYFHSRPSAAGTGYDGTSSGGTNLGASNPTLIQNVRRLAKSYRRENGLRPDAAVPIDAVTASGSGLDPDISRWNADLQTPRVAHARGLGESAVQAVVARYTRNRDLGILGEPRVSVLDLNLALDRATQSTPG